MALVPTVVATATEVSELAWREALDAEGVDCVQWLRAQDLTFTVETDFEPQRPSGASSRCTIDQPVRVGAQIGGVTFDHDEMLMGCGLARALVEMSELLEAREIVEVHVGTPYSCRTIRGRSRLSEHAHGLAIDVAAFVGADGTEYNIYDDWEHNTDDPESEEAQVLYDLVHLFFEEEIFNVLLTPNYDAAHDRWLHMDLTDGYRTID